MKRQGEGGRERGRKEGEGREGEGKRGRKGREGEGKKRRGEGREGGTSLSCNCASTRGRDRGKERGSKGNRERVIQRSERSRGKEGREFEHFQVQKISIN